MGGVGAEQFVADVAIWPTGIYRPSFIKEPRILSDMLWTAYYDTYSFTALYEFNTTTF